MSWYCYAVFKLNLHKNTKFVTKKFFGLNQNFSVLKSNFFQRKKKLPKFKNLLKKWHHYKTPLNIMQSQSSPIISIRK